MKVMTIVGTRPEIIKLSRVMAVIDECCDHIIVHTGQNYDYGLNEIFFDDLGIRTPDVFLNTVGNTAAEMVGNVIANMDVVLSEKKPDAVLILGDTNSCMGVYAAKRHKIPIFHMEAGNRCFDFRVPEEINRRVVDHLSDINMVYTEHARRYLLNEGLPGDQIIKTGSPQKEVLDFYKKSIDSSSALERFNLKKEHYFVVSIHREENVDNPKHLQKLILSLNAIGRRYNYPLVFSCHPRTKNRLKEAGLKIEKNISIVPPIGFFDYICLQKHAYCTVSDSGTITEESSIIGFPAVTVRQAHERPEGMDEGAVIMSGLNLNRILDSIELAVKQKKSFGLSRIVEDYNVEQVSWKVCKIIFSYTDFVRRLIWHENIS